MDFNLCFLLRSCGSQNNHLKRPFHVSKSFLHTFTHWQCQGVTCCFLATLGSDGAALPVTWHQVKLYIRIKQRAAFHIITTSLHFTYFTTGGGVDCTDEPDTSVLSELPANDRQMTSSRCTCTCVYIKPSDSKFWILSVQTTIVTFLSMQLI